MKRFESKALPNGRRGIQKPGLKKGRTEQNEAQTVRRRGGKNNLISVQASPRAPQKEMQNKPESRGLLKKYLKTKPLCKVTFRLPRDAAMGARAVNVVGDFNNWDHRNSRMKKLKNGDFHLTLNLPSNKEYKFKYLIDKSRWENDWSADRYDRNEFGTEDSVVIT